MCLGGFDCTDCGLRFFVTPGGRGHPPSPPPPPMPPYQAVNLYDRWMGHNEMLEFDTDIDANLAQAGPGALIGGCAGICGNYNVDDLETSPTNGFLDSQYPTAMPNPFRVRTSPDHGILCSRFSGRAYIPSDSSSGDGVLIHVEQPLGTRVSARVVVRGPGWDASVDAPLNPAIDHFYIMVDMVGNNVGDKVVWDRATTTVHCHDAGNGAHQSQPITPPAPPMSPSPPPGQALPPTSPPPPVGTLVNISDLFANGHVRYERAYDSRAVINNFILLQGNTVQFRVSQKHMNSLWLRFDVPNYWGRHCYRLRGTITASGLSETSDGFRFFSRWGDYASPGDGKIDTIVPSWEDRNDPPNDYVVDVNPLPNSFITGLINPAPFDFRLPGNIEGLASDRGFVLYMDNPAGYDQLDRADLEGTVECEEPDAAWTPASPPSPLPNTPVTHGCCSMAPYRRTCQVTSIAGYEGVGGNPTQGCGGTFCCNANGQPSGHGLCQDCNWWSQSG